MTNCSEGFRVENDSIGSIQISPANALYGAQTARSIVNFQIGSRITERMPVSLKKRSVPHLFQYYCPSPHLLFIYFVC